MGDPLRLAAVANIFPPLVRVISGHQSLKPKNHPKANATRGFVIGGCKHPIPYQQGSTAFAVDRGAHSGSINPPAELSGKINMRDSQSEVLAMASLHMGIPQCSTDRAQLSALNDMQQEAEPHWASFNSDTAKEVLVSADACMIYDGTSAAKPTGLRDTVQADQAMKLSR